MKSFFSINMVYVHLRSLNTKSCERRYHRKLPGRVSPPDVYGSVDDVIGSSTIVDFLDRRAVSAQFNFLTRSSGISSIVGCSGLGKI